jgi:hypothetical protein
VVTVQELRQQIQTGRQSFTTAKTQIAEAKARIPKITQESLRKERGIASRLRREKIRKAKTELETAEEKLLEKEKKFEETASSIEQKISKAIEEARRKAELEARTIKGYHEQETEDQEEFTQEEIGEAFQQSIAPELLTEQQKQILRARKDFSDIVKEAELKNLEMERFEELGYKPEEAKALAEESIARGGFTPAPDVAEQMLRERDIIPPKPFIEKKIFGQKTIILPSRQQLEYGIRKFFGEVEKGFDVGLKEVGIPKRFKALKASIEPIDIKTLYYQKKLIRQPKKEYTITAGKIVATAGDIASWFSSIGYIRAPIFLGSVAERTIKKEPVSPLEYGFAGLMLTGAAIAGVRGLKAREPKTKIEIIKPAPIKKTPLLSYLYPKKIKIPKQKIPKARQIALKKVKKITKEEELLRKIRVGKIGILKTETALLQLKAQEAFFKVQKIPKARQIALKKVKELRELEKQKQLIEKAKLLRKEAIKPTAWQIGQIKTKIRTEPELFIPKARQITLKKITKLTEQEKLLKEAKRLRELSPFERLSKIEQKWIKGQIKTKIRTEPELFIPKARQIALGKFKQKQRILKPTKEGAKRLVQLRKAPPLIIKAIKIKPKKIEVWKPKEPEIPKGYIPKKVGGLILLQKVKQKPQLKTKVQFIQKQKLRTAEVKVKLKTKTKLIQKQKIKTIRIPALMFKQKQIQKQIFKTKQAQKQKLKQIQKLVQLQVPKLAFKQAQIYKFKQAQKQKQRLKQFQKQKTKLIQKLKSDLPEAKTELIQKEKKVLVRGFEVYVKRRGKWIKISRKALPKAIALRLGAEKVRQTLAATFKVTPTKKRVRPTRIRFKPSAKIFRSYKIVKGKKVPLTDVFIQRRGKRLSTFGEVREIQKAKWL